MEDHVYTNLLKNKNRHAISYINKKRNKLISFITTAVKMQDDMKLVFQEE